MMGAQQPTFGSLAQQTPGQTQGSLFSSFGGNSKIHRLSD
jgi:hypothetical protein